MSDDIKIGDIVQIDIDTSRFVYDTEEWRYPEADEHEAVAEYEAWRRRVESFDGLFGRVERFSMHDTEVYLVPLSERPDSFDHAHFWWPSAELRILTADEIKKENL